MNFAEKMDELEKILSPNTRGESRSFANAAPISRTRRKR